MTCGESGHKDVDTSVVWLIVLEVGINDLQSVFVGNSHLVYVVEGIGDQSNEMGGVDCFGSGFEEVFPECAPETVEHECGGEMGQVCLPSLCIECHDMLCLQVLWSKKGIWQILA